MKTNAEPIGERAEEKVEKSGAEEKKLLMNMQDFGQEHSFRGSWVQTITTDQPSPEP